MHTFPLFTIAVSCLFISAIESKAQATFSVGPQVGYNLASVSYDIATGGSPFATYSYDTSYLSGFAAGLKVNMSVRHFAFQPAILFSQQGYKFSDTYNSLSSYTAIGTQIIRTNYISLPLQFAYTQGTEGRGLQIFAGPYFGFLLGGKYKYSTTLNYVSGNTTVTDREGAIKPGDVASANSGDTNLYQRRFDVGLQAGFGYRLQNTLLQVGYSWGLRNLSAAQSTFGISSPSPTIRNRAVMVSVAYLFGSQTR